MALDDAAKDLQAMREQLAETHNQYNEALAGMIDRLAAAQLAIIEHLAGQVVAKSPKKAHA